MAQPQLLQVKLSRFDAQPWGFRLQGGTDFAQPLLVQKVSEGGLRGVLEGVLAPTRICISISQHARKSEPIRLSGD